MRGRAVRRVVGLLALTGWGCLSTGEGSGASESVASTRVLGLSAPDSSRFASGGVSEPEAVVDGVGSAGLRALDWVTAPRPVTTTDEQTHLLPELIVQNVSDTAQRIAAVDVFEVGRRRPLASFSGAELAALVLGADPATGEIEPGAPAFVLLDVSLPYVGLARGQRWPRSLRAEVHTDTGEVAESPELAVLRERPIRLSPPLRGADLLGANGCCRGGHREALLADEEDIFVAQRFAIDFVRLRGLATSEGDPSDNESYFIFGDDVLAVAAGRVVAARDGMPENDPMQPLPPFDLETAVGNYVLQEVAAGKFALYAHLQLGSVRVNVGDQVRGGDVLGLVGNTGNSTEAHLHFHVVDRPSPLFADGLPYVFDHFQLQGHVDVSVPAIVPTPGPLARRDRLPMNLDVVAFE